VQASDLADDPSVLLDSLRPLHDEIVELSAILEEYEHRESQFPHRRRQLKLLHSLGRRILQAHLEWIDEVRRELQSGSPTSGAEREASDRRKDA
jgi:hypothetical protein